MLLLGSFIAHSAACVVPPPIDEIDDPANQPPRIDPTTLNPDPTQLPWRLSCTSRTFSAAIADPDVGDMLYWRVFINYRLLGANSGEEPHTKTPLGDPSLQFVVDQTDPRFLVSDDYHTIELFVSDRPFVADVAAPAGRAGRIVEEGGMTDTFVWPVLLPEECP